MDTVTIDGVEFVSKNSVNKVYKKQIDKVKEQLGDVMYDSLVANGAFIAGGAITSAFTNAEINDVDVYFKNFDSMRKAFLEVTEKWHNIYSSHTSKSITLIDKDTSKIVQFIYFDYFQNPDEIFKAFDFTVCMGALDLATDTLTLHDDFLADIASRTLHFNNGTRYPYISLIRTRKYKDKGYRIGQGNLLSIAVSCALNPLKSWEEAKEQLGGIYGYEIDLKIDESVPFSTVLLQQILASLPDKQPVVRNSNYDGLVMDLNDKAKAENV